MTLKYFANEAESQRYLCRCLRSGSEFGNRVAEILSGWRGRSFLFLPHEVKEIPANLLHGGICNRSEAISCLAAVLFYEVLVHRRVILFEHALAKKDDLFIKSLSRKMVFNRDEVYFLLEESGLSKGACEEAICDASTAQGFTAYILPHESLPQFSNNAFPVRSLTEVVSAVIVGAFDNETFLFWQRYKQLNSCALGATPVP